MANEGVLTRADHRLVSGEAARADRNRPGQRAPGGNQWEAAAGNQLEVSAGNQLEASAGNRAGVSADQLTQKVSAGTQKETSSVR